MTVKTLKPKSKKETESQAKVDKVLKAPAVNDWNTMTATERLELLRVNQLTVIETLDNFMAQLSSMAQNLTSLTRKVNAIVKISEEGKSLSNSTLKETVEEANVEVLRARTEGLVSSGILLKSDVTNLNSFVVGIVANAEGEIMNPRLQMMVKQVVGQDLEVLLDKKVGEKATFLSGGIFEIQEIYDIQKIEQAASVTPEQVEKAIEDSEEEFSEKAEILEESQPSA